MLECQSLASESWAHSSRAAHREPRDAAQRSRRAPRSRPLSSSWLPRKRTPKVPWAFWASSPSCGARRAAAGGAGAGPCGGGQVSAGAVCVAPYLCRVPAPTSACCRGFLDVFVGYRESVLLSSGDPHTAPWREAATPHAPLARSCHGSYRESARKVEAWTCRRPRLPARNPGRDTFLACHAPLNLA